MNNGLQHTKHHCPLFVMTVNESQLNEHMIVGKRNGCMHAFVDNKHQSPGLVKNLGATSFIIYGITKINNAFFSF